MQSVDAGSWQTSLSAFGLAALLFIATNRILMQSLFRALRQLLHWPGLYVPVVALLLLPGVLLHELSHALGAVILIGDVTEISVLPRVMEGEEIEFGSVKYRGVDPLRRILVGLMPIAAGSLALSLILSLGLRVHIPLRLIGAQQVKEVVIQELGVLVQGGWRSGLWWYLLFVIANAMIPSRQDLEGWLSMAAFVVIVAAGLYLTGTGVPSLPTNLVRVCLEMADYVTFALAGLVIVNLIVASPFVALSVLISALQGGEPA